MYGIQSRAWRLVTTASSSATYTQSPHHGCHNTLPDFACTRVMSEVVTGDYWHSVAVVRVNVSCDWSHQMKHALRLAAVLIVC